MIQLFPIDKVNRMRGKMEAVRRSAGDSIYEDGWHKSDLEPTVLLDTVECLWLKDGYTLRAYLYRSGISSKGIVWAMPTDSPFSEPSESTVLADQPECHLCKLL